MDGEQLELPFPESEQVIDCGFISLPVDLQDALWDRFDETIRSRKFETVFLPGDGMTVTPIDKDHCVICGVEIKTMCWRGTGVCSEQHRKDRDNDHAPASPLVTNYPWGERKTNPASD